MSSTTAPPTDISVPRPPAAVGQSLDPTAERRRWRMLAVLVIGQFMALLDATIVIVAMPDIGRDLHAGGSSLQLVVAGYTIAYAMLLITGARLGGLFGPRRLYLIGLATFTAASLACGLAPGIGVLITARFVQGAGAAAMIPQVFSVIQREFSGPARTRALSIYATVIATAAVVGQILGGMLVSADLFGTSWRPAFLVNVPIGAVLAVAVPRLVPGGRSPGSRRLDMPGLVLSTVAVLLLVLALVLGGGQGWPAWTWVSLAAGLVLATGFVLLERATAASGRHPLLNLDVLRAAGMRSALLALTAGMVSFAGLVFCLSLHLQRGLGDSPLRTGLTLVPGAFAFGALGYWWRRLPGRLHWALVPTGLALGAVGYLCIVASLRSGGHGGGWLTAALLVQGVGFGLAFSPTLTQALVRVPMDEATDASGLLTTTMQLGQVIGVAVAGSAFLGLAGDLRAHASAHALAAVATGLAVLLAAGCVPALLLARTVRAAARAG